MGYFSRLNILLMITVFKLQPQLFDYNYLHKCVYTYVSWLLFRLVEFSKNIATLAEISSELFVSRGVPILAPSGTGEPTTTYGLLPLRGGSARKTTFFRLVYKRPGGDSACERGGDACRKF